MQTIALAIVCALLGGCLALPSLDAMRAMPDKSGAAQCVVVSTAAGKAVLVAVRIDDELDRPPASVRSIVIDPECKTTINFAVGDPAQKP